MGDVVFRWSGQIMEPVDGLAFLGRSPGETDVYVITGDSGQGMTHGTVGAMIVADLIAGRPSPWAELYDPGRITLVGTTAFLPTLISALISGCATAVGDFCDVSRAYRPTVDELYEEENKRWVVAHNEYGQKHCGWMP